MEAHLVDTIDHLTEYVAAAQGVVSMEVAGVGPSRVVAVVKARDKPVGLALYLPTSPPHLPISPKARDKPVGLALQLTSCGVGTLVSEVTLTLTLTLTLTPTLILTLTPTPTPTPTLTLTLTRSTPRAPRRARR